MTTITKERVRTIPFHPKNVKIIKDIIVPNNAVDVTIGNNGMPIITYRPWSVDFSDDEINPDIRSINKDILNNYTDELTVLLEYFVQRIPHRSDKPKKRKTRKSGKSRYAVTIPQTEIITGYGNTWYYSLHRFLFLQEKFFIMSNKIIKNEADAARLVRLNLFIAEYIRNGEIGRAHV